MIGREASRLKMRLCRESQKPECVFGRLTLFSIVIEHTYAHPVLSYAIQGAMEDTLWKAVCAQGTEGRGGRAAPAREVAFL